MNEQEVNINFDNIKEIANRGVRRAIIFMGLGLNAAKDDRLSNYELTKFSIIQLVPQNLGSTKVKGFKEEFASWIVTCGLREVIETFSIFLDEIYTACLLISHKKENIPFSEFRKRIRVFSRNGLRDKFNSLNTEIGLDNRFKEHLVSINDLRNCLAHRRGIVGEKDCNTDGTFILKWRGPEIFAELTSGERINLDCPIPPCGIKLESGGVVKARFTEKQLIFRNGDVIRLSPQVITEICYFVTFATEEVVKEALAFSDASGIPRKIG